MGEGGGGGGGGRCSCEEGRRTVAALRNIIGGPPVVQRGKKRSQGQLRVNEVDNAELVVDVERAAVVLQYETLSGSLGGES